MSYTADTLKRSYQKNHSEQRKKNLLKLRESIAKMSLTEFSKEIGIQKSNLSFLEMGIEPTLLDWKSDVLAIKLLVHIVFYSSGI